MWGSALTKSGAPIALYPLTLPESISRGLLSLIRFFLRVAITAAQMPRSRNWVLQQKRLSAQINSPTAWLTVIIDFGAGVVPVGKLYEALRRLRSREFWRHEMQTNFFEMPSTYFARVPCEDGQLFSECILQGAPALPFTLSLTWIVLACINVTMNFYLLAVYELGREWNRKQILATQVCSLCRAHITDSSFRKLEAQSRIVLSHHLHIFFSNSGYLIWGNSDSTTLIPLKVCNGKKGNSSFPHFFFKVYLGLNLLASLPWSLIPTVTNPNFG